MNPIRVQGALFSVVAFGLSVASIFIERSDSMSQLTTIAVLIFILGVPHGALDPLFAGKLFPIEDAKNWFKFFFYYVFLATLVIGLWMLYPVLFMFFFLAMSTLHFSRDLNPQTPFTTKLLYGGAAIVLPNLLHSSNMSSLFSIILGSQNSELVIRILVLIAPAWILLLLCAIFIEFKRDRAQALEMSALTLMAICAQPLIAFTAYFCLMHSIRHILRAQKYLLVSWGQMLVTAVWPMAIVGLVVYMSWGWGWGWGWGWPDSEYSRTIQFIYVGLAALTLPHVLLIDRINYHE